MVTARWVSMALRGGGEEGEDVRLTGGGGVGNVGGQRGNLKSDTHRGERDVGANEEKKRRRNDG